MASAIDVFDALNSPRRIGWPSLLNLGHESCSLGRKQEFPVTKLFLGICSLLVFSATVGYADEVLKQNLLKVSNNQDTNFNVLALDLDQTGAIVGTEWSTYDQSGKQIEKIKKFPAKALSTSRTSTGRKGVVLVAEQNVEGLLLRGKIGLQEAELTISHVYEGMKEKVFGGTAYPDCTFQLKRAETGWIAINFKSQPIESATIMATASGIDTIRGICPARKN
jgi:hypothetical protein